MELRLTDEEKLVGQTAARFVDKELIAREGAYLKQKELFLPPGDPPLRALDREIWTALKESAERVGLWALELPDAAGGSALGWVAQLLIYREFGRTILPFEPPCAPAIISPSRYATPVGAGEITLTLKKSHFSSVGSGCTPGSATIWTRSGLICPSCASTT